MKITRIEATSHRVPAKVPLLHEPIMREIVFVRVETDGGVTGYGLTGPIQRFAARELINREIAPLLVGKDPLATERLWYDLFVLILLGIAGYAIAMPGLTLGAVTF